MIILTVTVSKGKSSMVVINSNTKEVLKADYNMDNNDVLDDICNCEADLLLLGIKTQILKNISVSDLDETLWCGRIIERFLYFFEAEYEILNLEYVYTYFSKKTLELRKKILERYPPIGGGKYPQIGVGNKPGPLYGFKGNLFLTLALAHTFIDKFMTKK